MPKTQDKNSFATKDSKVASQASGSSCGAKGHPRPSQYELPLPTDMDLKIQQAHRSLLPKPRPEAPSRPLIINCQEFTTKETVLREAWKRGKIQLSNRPLFFVHDYATEIVQKRREYNKIKKCLKAKGIRFQTPYTSMRIHWDSGVRTYTSAHDMGRELQRQGYSVEVPCLNGRGGPRRDVAERAVGLAATRQEPMGNDTYCG